MTTRTFALVLSFIVLFSFGSLESRAFFGPAPIPIQPTTVKPAIVYNASALAKEDRLLLSSLQGLVNRQSPQLYVFKNNGSGSDEWIGSKVYGLSKDYNKYTIINNRNDLINYAKSIKGQVGIKGAVLYNKSEPWQINIASNLAGLKDVLMVNSASLASQLGLSVTYNLAQQFAHLNGLPQSSKLYDAYVWLLQNNWLNFDMSKIAVYSADDMFDLERDLAVMKKHLMIPFPGTATEKNKCIGSGGVTDADYSEAYRGLIKFVLQHFPANIPILGWYQVESAGRSDFYGVCERTGVKLFGEFGKFTWGTSFATNLSYHINKNPNPVLKQKAVARNIHFDPSKIYVAFTMMESGDHVGYHQWGFNRYQWGDKERGSVPISYGITPGLYELMPAVAKYLYNTASPSDYFFTSLGGAGYMYAFDGYGQLGTRVFQGVSSNPGKTAAQIVREYYIKTADYMEKMDHDSFALYSVSFNENWDSLNHYNYVASNIAPNMPKAKSILSDMGKLANINSFNANEVIGGKTVFHTLTRWWIPQGPGLPDDMVTPLLPDNPNQFEREAWDGALANWLAFTIEAETANNATNFVNAMAYSWHYGPKRLKMVKDLLEPKGYVFVTTEELDILKRANP